MVKVVDGGPVKGGDAQRASVAQSVRDGMDFGCVDVKEGNVDAGLVGLKLFAGVKEDEIAKVVVARIQRTLKRLL